MPPGRIAASFCFHFGRGVVVKLPHSRAAVKPTPQHARRTRMQSGAQGNSQKAANWHPAVPGAPPMTRCPVPSEKMRGR